MHSNTNTEKKDDWIKVIFLFLLFYEIMTVSNEQCETRQKDGCVVLAHKQLAFGIGS